MRIRKQLQSCRFGSMLITSEPILFGTTLIWNRCYYIPTLVYANFHISQRQSSSLRFRKIPLRGATIRYPSRMNYTAMSSRTLCCQCSSPAASGFVTHLYATSYESISQFKGRFLYVNLHWERQGVVYLDPMALALCVTSAFWSWCSIFFRDKKPVQFFFSLSISHNFCGVDNFHVNKIPTLEHQSSSISYETHHVDISKIKRNIIRQLCMGRWDGSNVRSTLLCHKLQVSDVDVDCLVANHPKWHGRCVRFLDRVSL